MDYPMETLFSRCQHEMHQMVVHVDSAFCMGKKFDTAGFKHACQQIFIDPETFESEYVDIMVDMLPAA
eukprot:10843148-Karenia_brevis.AAC.1